MDINSKFRIDTTENQAYMAQLRGNLLGFGHRFPAPQGGAYYLGDDGTPWPDRGLETWICGRMAHVYALGVLLGHKGSERLANAALQGLCGIFHDGKNGGWYAGRTSEGNVLAGKLCYAHAFVILAASSCLLAERKGAKELLEEALEVFDHYFWDETKGLAMDSWNTDFTEPDNYRGINANMHTVEAFLAVADAIGREEYRARAGKVIDHVVSWAKDNQWRIPEHFTRNWEPDLEYNKERPADPFKPYGATPGHAIEWARLIVQWAEAAIDQSEKRRPYFEAARQLYGQAVADAWGAGGHPGFAYTTDWAGNTLVYDRMHWTLAEAINTSAILYRVTGQKAYGQDFFRYLSYLDDKVLDKTTGSWFHQLDRENRPISTVWPGKSDLYHAVQATLIPYALPGLSICAAVKGGKILVGRKEM